MKKICLLLSVLVLAACGNQNSADPENTPGGRAGGQIGGTGWQMVSAIYYAENGKFDITITGSGDPVDCNNNVPKKNHLNFLVPPQVGKYEFDLNKPSSAPVFFVFRQGQNVEMKIAKTSVIQIDSFTANRVFGRLTAESSGTGTTAGSVNGTFEAVLCK